MPIYEYRCENCDHCFERLMLAGEEETHLRCPVCGKEEIRKLVSCVSPLGTSLGGLCASGSSSRIS
jgi:putative FmdB family regulatory protein